MSDETNTIAETPKSRVSDATREPITRLGHFQLLEQIGEGGMGTVFSAYDLRLDRKVAIKLLLEGITSDQQSHQRLLREAQAMAKLSHPNVVPIYEVGVDGNTLFIAMEYIAGKTLGEWLKTKPTWRAIVDVYAQAGRGLAAAHEAGIVHRDFKPANVLVDARGHARVTDFGIAQVSNMVDVDDFVTGQLARTESKLSTGELTPPSPSVALTEQGAVIGTPAYMSPEQFRGATVDARSDQFSFCVSLYEALFGKRPFAGKGKDLARNVREGRIEKPSSALPGWVTAIVMRGLDRDPDKRFASMTELVEALGRDPVRLRKRIAIGAGAAIVIAGGAVVAGWALHTDPDAACRGAESHLAGAWDDGVRAAVSRSFVASNVPYAEASDRRIESLLDDYRGRWIAMHTEACRATHVSGEQSTHVLDLRMACLDRRLGELRALTTVLSSSADAKVIEHAVEAASALTPVTGCADTAALLHPTGEPTDPVLRARRGALHDRLDHLVALEHLGRYKEALAPARVLATEVRVTGEPGAISDALRLQGGLETAVDDLKAAEVTLADALRVAHQGGDPDAFVATALELVEALSHAGISKSREALGVIRVAQAMVDDTRDPALPIRLTVEQANDLVVLARAPEALPLLDDAGRRCKRTLGDDHVLCFHILSVRAIALKLAKKPADARATYETLVTGLTRVLGPLHPTTLVARLDMCRAMTTSGDHEHAIGCYDAALPDAERVIGPEHRGVLMARVDYSATLDALGRFDRMRDVLAIAYDHVPAESWKARWYVAADIARLLGEAELQLGEYANAATHCARAGETMEKEHRGIAEATCVGEAQLALGDPTHAVATLEPLGAQLDGELPSEVATWQFAYARALWAAKHQAKQARELAERSRPQLSPEARTALDAWLATVPR